MKWTKQQEEAIYSGGENILVAAAAGSGKTAVLVERVIQKLVRTDHPVDIDSLLIVTFTNAAAQEMRNRIGSALEKALAENPSSNHLKKQLSLLQRASISTLHSFCMNVVRQYAYLLDIDPAFRIATDIEIDLLKQDVLDELFEEWYGMEGEDQEVFFKVVDRFSDDRSDTQVEQLILTLHTFAMQNPWPREWLNQLAKDYYITENWSEADFSWLTILKQNVNYQLQAIERDIDEALRLARLSDGPYHYIDAIESDLEQVKVAQDRLHSWDDLQTFMEECSFQRLSSKRVECNEDIKDKVRKKRDDYRKRWNDMKDQLFKRNLEGHLADLQELYPIIRHLIELVLQFHERFMQHKKDKGVLDFSDLEHYCLQLLIDDTSTSDNLKPSKVAQQFQRQFQEILVDEYQDINLVQETILNLLSNQDGNGNMFMVGDVKQSIYRFRHAEPDLFIAKYHQFASSDTRGSRIDLAKNFRSRKHILTGVNYLFRQIFDEQIGEIAYDKNAELMFANKDYEDLPGVSSQTELILIDREKEDEGVDEQGERYQDLEYAQLEARMYAKKIKQWVGKNSESLEVFDLQTGKNRPVQYRDIVILLRSMTEAPTIVDELKKQDIPVYAELSTGYFEAIEIQVMINMLKIIDNPLQDIPLASVLKSPIVGLDEEELANIRLADQKGLFYHAVQKFVDIHDERENPTAQKLAIFLRDLKQFQFLAKQGALSELIWNIYRLTGYYDFVGGIPGGRQRQANLRALYDRARHYETTSFRGLFRFLRFIERMEERGDDLGAARALSEQEDVVRITTIHKSKGLEFPVVIVGGMNKQFNMRDLYEKYLLHKDMGFASKYIDPVKRITYPTLFYQAMQREKLREQLSEEMRVLYVALTRAKEKLVMIGNVPSFEEKRKKWQQIISHQDWVLPIHLRLEAKSFLDWIGPALVRHNECNVLRETEHEEIAKDIFNDSSTWYVEIKHASELMDADLHDRRKDISLQEHIVNWQPVQSEDDQLAKEVKRRMEYRYPHVEATHARAKQTVTEIKRMHESKDEYSADQYVKDSHSTVFSRPKFMQKEHRMTAAEVGTVMHTIMQHLPFKRPLSVEDISFFIDTFIEKEIITKEEARAVNIESIAHFYETELAQYMIQVENIYREVPFSLTLPASEVYPMWDAHTDERVLIQGVIDCVIPGKEGWIILDYKTDAIDRKLSETVKDDLRQKYEVQMNFYKKAIEHIWKNNVEKTYIYYFSKQLLLEI